VNFNLKFFLVIALIGIIVYDWRQNHRLDYLLLALLCAAGTPIDARAQLLTPSAMFLDVCTTQKTIISCLLNDKNVNDNRINPNTITGRIYAKALELLDQNPEGISWTDLNDAIQKSYPNFHPKTINGCV
jgi:hypothetical protein